MIRSLDDELAARNLRDAGAALVSCASNPCDLGPAVTGIMARIESVRASLRAGQKLVVVLGETHAVASHRMLQALLMARLHEKSISVKDTHFAAGVELPHNFMATKLADLKQPSLPPVLQSHFDHHMGSAGLIRAFLDDNPLIEAPQSKSFLFNVIGARGISLRFNDVAVRYGSRGNRVGVPCLDERDGATRALLNGEALPVYCEDSLGVKLRNKFMAENITAHLQAENSDVYIQMAGSAHVLGDRSEGAFYEHSLHNLLVAEGHAVLSVLPVEGGVFGMHHWWDSMLSDQAREAGLPDTMIVTDMIRKRFHVSEADAECLLIKKILTQSTAHDITRPAQQKDWRRKLARFKTDLPHWVDEAKKSYRKEALSRPVAPCAE